MKEILEYLIPKIEKWSNFFGQNTSTMAGRILDNTTLPDFLKAANRHEITFSDEVLYQLIKKRIEDFYPRTKLPDWVKPELFYKLMAEKLLPTVRADILEDVLENELLEDLLKVSMPYRIHYPFVSESFLQDPYFHFIDPSEYVWIDLPVDFYSF